MVNPLSLSVGGEKVIYMNEFQISKDFIRISSLSHAFYMVANLPRFINSKIEPILQFAALEDWFVNMRLIIEFFRLSSSGNQKDFSIDTYSAAAICPDDARREMNEIWLIASKHVVHFSHERTELEKVQDNPFDFSNENLKRLVDILVDVAQNFEKQLRLLGFDEADLIKLMHEQATKSLSNLVV
jgi:hypothetical protein